MALLGPPQQGVRAYAPARERAFVARPHETVKALGRLYIQRLKRKLNYPVG